MAKNYVRAGKIPLQLGIKLLQKWQAENWAGLEPFKKVNIKKKSQRYILFLRYKDKLKCVTCGAKATYFAVEKDPYQGSNYHLNLYGVNEEGETIMLTKDHILPKAKGGRNIQSNYQLMCNQCNSLKGDGTETTNLKPKLSQLKSTDYISLGGKRCKEKIMVTELDGKYYIFHYVKTKSGSKLVNCKAICKSVFDMLNKAFISNKRRLDK